MTYYETTKCNQCGVNMEYTTYIEIYPEVSDRVHFHFCINPKCPNYALLQMPAEAMKDIEENK